MSAYLIPQPDKSTVCFHVMPPAETGDVVLAVVLIVAVDVVAIVRSC